MPTPYGEWPSPVAPEDVAADVRSFVSVETDGDHVYWLERRPSEGGRGVVCRVPVDDSGADPTEVTPEELDVRTLVHQYGGGDALVADGTVLAASMDDQRLYRLPADGSAAEGDAEPTPVTPEPPEPMAHRYADMRLAPDGETVYAVRERHAGPGTDEEPQNELVRFPLSPGPDPETGFPDPVVVAAGHDFYAAPRPAPDGDRIAYLRWDHPNMPWDGTELVVGAVDETGDIRDERVVAGGADESVVSPTWSPDGVLHAAADPTGWWNLYRFPVASETEEEERAAGLALPTASDAEGLREMPAAFGVPMWTLGVSTFAFLGDGRIATLVTEGGDPSLRLLDPETGDLVDPGLPYSSFRPASVQSDGDRVVFAGHRTDAPSAVVAWRPRSAGTGPTRLRESTDDALDAAYVSEPEPIAFPTGDAVGADDATAYGHYYPPHNPDAEAPADAAPPLLVRVHGGPTSRSEASLSSTVQFWTTRGVGVLTVNYRGSTGYGRAFREALTGEWGVRDVLDCVNAARYAPDEGFVDPDRLAISGGSAGGFAVLAALAFHDTFDAGASYYGVADLRALAAETHKFESRYLDGLVGPLPEAADVYEARSPVAHAEGVTAPLLLLQGGEDEVVPPAQAEAMIDALVANETPYAYVEFPEERHGFRDADNVARAHAAELAFYGAAFDFDPAGDVADLDLLVGERPE
ncbi:peptidase S9 prolyl oligopeptidase active site domain-containing protein [Halorubrum californiense DSM 19288]|uniref:Peptidase S9 prolyl oligopeptidase active site domain-containing protein n=1 Tax=Halorubrum californiense DSM 19288 TaxID=1227465 RepID=M0EC06_9EURY|nr:MULTISPECIES: prolyl oligopeptidase family serine peptidase [Halorubrum]ELZ44548.1 peptidase S9 prolyl oligopeptidase active site domain-containing protein [Halorubrum californiense DSM 19288]TKX72017.1 S9 family peptidase [Halorubrum sp. GN11GM_10-3_MGM]